MLNRRTLRAKTVQALYNYKRCRAANIELARDQIKAVFSPNYSLPSAPDIKTLTKKENASLSFFQNKIDGIPPKSHSETLEDAFENAQKAYDFYLSETERDKKRIGDSFREELESLKEFYLLLLALIIKISERAGTISEDFISLSNNRIINTLKKNEKLITYGKSDKTTIHSEFVHKIIKKALSKDSDFHDLLNKKDDTDNVFAVADYLAVNILLKSEPADDYFDDLTFLWEEKKPILKGMLRKTLKNIRDGIVQEDCLLDLSPDWPSDSVFAFELYEKTVENEEEYQKIIAEKAKKWEADRITATDTAVLTVAISELIHFPSIPVKVTINEYIELAKSFGTAKSGIFVNGMLDKIATDLIENKSIKKSGKGLIDNK